MRTVLILLHDSANIYGIGVKMVKRNRMDLLFGKEVMIRCYV